MKKAFLIITISMLIPFSAFAVVERPINILFLGNSLTYTNDIPNTLRQIAAAEGITIIVYVIANGGWTLNNHLNSVTSTSAIASGGWDYVVLQEQSQTSVYNPSQFASDAAALNTLITAAGARTVLYQNWPITSEIGYQTNYDTVWRTVASNLCAVLVPAGDAWYDLYLNDNATWATLYGDDRHPTQRGAYLTACVFYSVLFGRAPTKSDPVFSLGATLSTQFQAAAEGAVSPWRAVASITSTDTDATEGGDTAAVNFNVSLADICDTVIYYSLSGTAQPGVDTYITPSFAIIPAGATTTALAIDALVDGLAEGDETFIINIWGGPYYSVGAQDSVTINFHDQSTPTQTATATETATETPAGPTFTATETATATQTASATETATITYTMTVTATPTFTATQPTATATATPTATNTAVPVNFDPVIYPNPAKDSVSFWIGDITGYSMDIRIYTQGFRLVLESMPANEPAGIYKMDTSRLENGVYIACFMFEKEGRVTKKVKPFVVLR